MWIVIPSYVIVRAARKILAAVDLQQRCDALLRLSHRFYIQIFIWCQCSKHFVLPLTTFELADCNRRSPEGAAYCCPSALSLGCHIIAPDIHCGIFSLSTRNGAASKMPKAISDTIHPRCRLVGSLGSVSTHQCCTGDSRFSHLSFTGHFPSDWYFPPGYLKRPANRCKLSLFELRRIHFCFACLLLHRTACSNLCKTNDSLLIT